MIRRKTKWVLLGLLVAQCLAVSCAKAESPRLRENFDMAWRFHLGDVPAASEPDFDDSQWRSLRLPHDWSIEGEFSREHPAGAGGGALPGGVGWYRKDFPVDKADQGKCFFIDFDGVYMLSEVFINGHSLGVRPFGYIGFRYDLTPYLRFDEPNTLAVRVDNSLQPNSRWYSGSGIYRHVWLTKVNPVHVDLWGTYVTTPEVSAEKARIHISTTLVNEDESPVEASLTTLILDPEGSLIQKQTTSSHRLQNGSSQEISQEMEVPEPRLWSLENPTLYTVRTEVRVDNRLSDVYETPFGIRTFRFDAEQGFFLNEQHLKIKGVCQHHDLGCLGAAINRRALERQLEILREMGCNSIRCSHNPPAPELLDLCDRMGFLVMDEAFDVWRKRKTAYDYSLYFNEWHERDLSDLVRRDRNHPSIILWSIGNEVLEQWTHADADTLSLQEANLILNVKRDDASLRYDGESMSVNSLLTLKLAQIVRELDPTRPITAGNNEGSPKNHLFRSGALDVIGYNYQSKWWQDVPVNFPGKPFLLTESTSGLMTRGYYRMPSDSVYVWPERWDKPFSDPTYACSSYDNCHVPWGTTHEESWRMAKENDYVGGLYVWTGFDYLGEPTPFDFPARSSYFGIVDLAGFPKDIYYMYQSEWTNRPVLHLFPHWNWTEGQEIDLWAYFNGADEVELFVNGVSQGIRRKASDSFHLSWRVIYEPGSIRALARKDGKEVMHQEIRTAGEPAQIRLTPDRSTIKADGNDLSFVRVEILDAEGNLCPWADNRIDFSVAGCAYIAGVDNGNPVSMESFQAPHRKAFYGKCLLVLQNDGASGQIRLRASSPGLPVADLNLSAEN